MFISAALLFVVEPMFAKMVLPLLGGSPAVWTTCMLFFQGALLVGYVYAHVSPRWFGMRRSMVLHLGLLVLALLLLPIEVSDPSGTLRRNYPTLWLLLVLCVSLGGPFILLSSTGPLLQLWFSATSDPEAHDPYFLYSASNAGSLLALLSYPMLLEPALSLRAQAGVWSWGYLTLIGLIGVSAASLVRAPTEDDAARNDRELPVDKRTVARWIALAFVPSSFLLALTTHITTDMAAVPLLWIVPLVLYLLSFAMVFSRRSFVPHALLVRWQPIGLITLAVLEFWGQSASSLWLLPLHLIVFFVTALVCHGELAVSRPPASGLTRFYLCIAVGGVAGGIFNALLAPALFDSVLEYPVTILLACAVRPRSDEKRLLRSSRLDIPLIVFASLILLLTRVAFRDRPVSVLVVLASALAATICLRMSRDRRLFTLAVAGLVVAAVVADEARPDILLKERNFFGVRAVRRDTKRHMHVLLHGTTRHGAQSTLPQKRREPTSYYYRGGPLGDIFRALPSAAGRQVAVIGLGAGGMAAYAGPGEKWTFFEIDPDIARLANDTSYFTYLRDTPAEVEIVLGDGRLSLLDRAPHSYDLIVLDAFSSDAIPTHLLTAEALSLYISRLKSHGVLVFHLSNRYLNLEPVVGRLFESLGVSGLIRVNTAPTRQLLDSGGDPSIWAAASFQDSDIRGLRQDQRWRSLQTRSGVPVWTDDFSNIFTVLRWPGTGGKQSKAVKQAER